MKLLYFDYCALTILIVMMFTTVIRGLTKGRLNGYFMLLIGLAIFSTISDIASVKLDELVYIPQWIKYLSHTAYLVSHNLQTPLYVLYLMILTDTDYRLKGATKVLFYVPFSVVTLIALINPFNGLLFYFNEAGGYTRGILFPSLYISAIIYIFHIFKITFRYGFSLGYKSMVAISGILPFLLTAVVIQFLFPNFLLEMFANAMSLLLCASLINRPEDILDTDTGLSNKKAYVDGINRCLRNGKPLELILVNITNYSFLQSIVGYEGMLRILRKVSNRFSSTNRSGRYFSELYYLGEGKFCLQMDYRKFNKTAKTAHYINDILRPAQLIGGAELSLDAITCIVKCPADIADVESLIAFQNDLGSTYFTGEVLYASEIYKGNHYDLMRQIDSIIESALTNKSFEVYYQPIYSIREDRFNSAEALIRLHDDHFGYISPEFFIPAAEKSGAIHRIGSFVLEEVCAFISSQDFKDLSLDYIEVNLSATQCMRSDLYKEVLGIIRKYGVDHSKINLEITETAAVCSQDSLLENMRKLESRGITFSLDDFGTGYSNMDRVSNMNFNIIKLDKSFVNVQRNIRRDIVLNNTVNMIKSLGMKIVVEGVETAEILQRFADLKCDYIQGFFFSKPLPKQEFITYICTHNR